MKLIIEPTPGQLKDYGAFLAIINPKGEFDFSVEGYTVVERLLYWLDVTIDRLEEPEDMDELKSGLEGRASRLSKYLRDYDEVARP